MSVEVYERKINRKHQLYTISVVKDGDEIFKSGKYVIACGGCSRIARFKTEDYSEIASFIIACEVLIEKHEEMLESGQTDLTKYLIEKEFKLCQ